MQVLDLAAVALSFDVIGEPQTAGSKTAFKHPETGKVIVTESGNRTAKRTWRGDVRDAALNAIGERTGWPTAGPVAVEFTFYRVRPKGHYGTGRNAGVLKHAVPQFPLKAPDVLKLSRAVEDALTGIVYVDDAQIVNEVLFKRYGRPGVSVLVRKL